MYKKPYILTNLSSSSDDQYSVKLAGFAHCACWVGCHESSMVFWHLISWTSLDGSKPEPSIMGGYEKLIHSNQFMLLWFYISIIRIWVKTLLYTVLSIYKMFDTVHVGPGPFGFPH